MGGCEPGIPVPGEPQDETPPLACLSSNPGPVNPGGGQCYLGSLTGAVSSQKVTEESKGTLSPVGNRAASVKVEGCLTASAMARAGTKVGLSDPVAPDGRAIAQQIKGTPGITGLSPLSVHSGEEVWHLDVGSSHPGAGENDITSLPGGNVRVINGLKTVKA